MSRKVYVFVTYTNVDSSLSFEITGSCCYCRLSDPTESVINASKL